jgi:hypothetical protein
MGQSYKYRVVLEFGIRAGVDTVPEQIVVLAVYVRYGYRADIGWRGDNIARLQVNRQGRPK